ncbi:MAG: T9SS type A sorting domain-containing protein [Candidatus Kryptoniota bacterium]
MKKLPRFLFVVFCLLPITHSLRAQWVQTDGPYGANISCFAVSGSNLFAGSFDGDGVFVSTNNGASWTVADSGLTNTNVYSLAVSFDTPSDTNLFAGTNGGVFLSTNNGTSWTPVNTGLTNTQVNALAVSPNGAGGTNLFAGTDGGVFLSTNHGTSWSAADSGLTTNTAILSLAVAPNGAGGTSLFAGTDSGIFLSTNSGASWTAADLGLPTNTAVLCLAVSPNGEGDTNLYAGTGDGVFLSTNNGTSWIQFNVGLTDTLVYSFAIYSNVIFVGTYGGIFYFANDWYMLRGKLISEGWLGFNDGLSSIPSVLSLIVSGNSILAGISGLGVWVRPISDVTAVTHDGSNAPMRFSLFQNYPNPFNPTTTIGYALPANSFVTLKVYDLLGRELKTLVNEHQNAGSHSATFNASNLPSGVYFYRLSVGSLSGQTGLFMQTKKLVLIK